MTTEAPVALRDTDDLMHENTGETTFNESAYFNFYDPERRLGGFVRVGNRPNEGHAEMTMCLYLPEGSAAFMFWRAELDHNDRFDAAGLRLEVLRPFAEHRIIYDGSCCLMRQPLDLLDPRREFAENPQVQARIDLRYEHLSEAFGGEPTEAQRDRPEFFRGHFEQHGRAKGRVVIDRSEHAIDGCGLRDRSWGPRTWQAFERYRWLTMNFGPDAGIAAALIIQRDGREVHGGYLYRAGEPNRPLRRVELETQCDSRHGLHERLSAVLYPADDGAPVRVEGSVLQMVPLRNRRGGVTTRIAEGLTEWRWGQRVGYGWSEYLDHATAATAGSSSR
jgi:hypothetical protein